MRHLDIVFDYVHVYFAHHSIVIPIREELSKGVRRGGGVACFVGECPGAEIIYYIIPS